MNALVGHIVSGTGAASTTITRQMPLFLDLPEFRACRDELGRCRRATLNVSLVNPLIILGWDVETESITWEGKHSEQFSFLGITFRCNGNRAKGWV